MKNVISNLRLLQPPFYLSSHRYFDIVTELPLFYNITIPKQQHGDISPHPPFPFNFLQRISTLKINEKLVMQVSHFYYHKCQKEVPVELPFILIFCYKLINCRCICIFFIGISMNYNKCRSLANSIIFYQILIALCINFFIA